MWVSIQLNGNKHNWTNRSKIIKISTCIQKPITVPIIKKIVKIIEIIQNKTNLTTWHWHSNNLK